VASFSLISAASASLSIPATQFWRSRRKAAQSAAYLARQVATATAPHPRAATVESFRSQQGKQVGLAMQLWLSRSATTRIEFAPEQ
jgi:hypothetical protein